MHHSSLELPIPAYVQFGFRLHIHLRATVAVQVWTFGALPNSLFRPPRGLNESPFPNLCQRS